jgi:uncharacterized protein YegL
MVEHVIFIIDISASVEKYKDTYLNTINNIIEYQRKLFPQSHITIATFNHNHDFYCINQKVVNINLPTITSSGCTAIYDNVIAIINRMKKFSDIQKSDSPLVIILTDGVDNCSAKTNERLLWLQITMTRAYGWKYIYLGTSENSMETGKNIGCNACVLYETTEQSFKEVVNVVGYLMKEKVKENVDIDIREITNNMERVNIN